MAYTPIDKSSDYFNTVLYTGNSSTQAIAVGFQPDWVWCKPRTNTGFHFLTDSVRGGTKVISSNSTAAEITRSNNIQSFTSTGYTLGADGTSNFNGDATVSWNWKAGGSASSNSNGSITSSVSANQDAGFSIVSYTGNGTGGATIGHGLGVAPKIVIIKRRNSVDSWIVWLVGTTQYRLVLNLTNASDTAYPISTSSTIITTPSTVDSHWNASGSTYIAYCFAEKQGFSKFGSYVGNGSTDGTFVYTGFKPAWVLVKRSSSSGDNWILFNNKINPFNVEETFFEANSNDAEKTSGSHKVDFLSNGFKWRATGAGSNGSGSTYIFMAFAENPLVTSTGIPSPAR